MLTTVLPLLKLSLAWVVHGVEPRVGRQGDGDGDGDGNGDGDGDGGFGTTHFHGGATLPQELQVDLGLAVWPHDSSHLGIVFDCF